MFGSTLSALKYHRLFVLYLFATFSLVILIWSSSEPILRSARAPLHHASSFFEDTSRRVSATSTQPECQVPALHNPEDVYTPLEAAFALAWKRRCQLNQEKFTIMMTSSNPRLDVVKRNMKRFTSGEIPSIGAIHLRWIGELPAEPLYDSKTSTVPVQIVQQANGSLNARWQPIPDLTTAWVFSHDDDLEIDSEDFEWAWQISKEFRPAFTSFVGRRWKFDTQKNEPTYDVGKEGDSIAMGTSASWIHSAFMDIYNHAFLGPVRDMVHETQNCEDIAMAFIVPYITHTPPLLVNGLHDVTHWQFRANMVSGEKSHWLKRDLCTRSFYKYFGEMPAERAYTVLRGMGPGARKIRLKEIPR